MIKLGLIFSLLFVCGLCIAFFHKFIGGAFFKFYSVLSPVFKRLADDAPELTRSDCESSFLWVGLSLSSLSACGGMFSLLS